MNKQVRSSDLLDLRTVPQALAGRRWTTAELRALVEAGTLDPDVRFELIYGEVVPMAPIGRHHEIVSDDLADQLIRFRSSAVRVKVEPQFNLTDELYTKPDVLVRPASILMPDVRGPDALLVIEIADSSFDYDTTTKAGIYAERGVREYWVIEAKSLETHVFLDPGSAGYGRRDLYVATDRLVPHLVPDLALRLADVVPASSR